MEDMFRNMMEQREISKRDGHAAALTNDPGVQPEVGHHYTVSPNFVCGDRSFTRFIFKVAAVNASHVLVEAVFGDKPFWEGKILIPINEQYWYNADNMVEK